MSQLSATSAQNLIYDKMAVKELYGYEKPSKSTKTELQRVNGYNCDKLAIESALRGGGATSGSCPSLTDLKHVQRLFLEIVRPF